MSLRDMSLLDERPSATMLRFRYAMRSVGIDNYEEISQLASASVAYLSGSKAERRDLDRLRDLEHYWYATLDVGAPDYGVYSSPLYLAEAWACYVIYSRKNLRSIRASRILDDLGEIQSIVDLGCGLGFTTAALSESFPDARIVGTNVEGSPQTLVARFLSDFYNYTVSESYAGPVDVLFASEYFEHFPAPIGRLRHELALAEPRALIVANTFTSPSIGHFRTYLHEGEEINGRATARAFSATLRDAGYEKAETGFWNNRPAVWKRAR